MGKARNRKWERRFHPDRAHRLKNLDPEKVTAASLRGVEARFNRAWDKMLSENASRRHSEAVAKLDAVQARKQKARRHRGWLPMAQR